MGRKGKTKMKTPCYIIEKEELESGIKLLKDSLQTHWNHYVIGYSFKTNSLPWVVEKMKKEGFFAEVVSENEYFLAKKFGYTNLIYNGPVKGEESFYDALASGSIINLDAKRELVWLKNWWSKNKEGAASFQIGLRVNFNVEEAVPGETSAGEEGSRFGFSYETGELKEAMDTLKEIGIPLSGLHLHISSKTRSVAIYRALAKKACELKEEYQLELKYVDVGGGYFGGMKNRPQFPDYVKAVSEELQTGFSTDETMLIMEPGTSIITPPIRFVTTVVDVRETYANRIVTVDGSRIDVDPLHTKSSYFYEIISKDGEKIEDRKPRIKKQVICGLTCMENDRLMVLEDTMALQEGDQIVFYKVGGYTMCLTPLFIRYFPRVYLEEKGELSLVRNAWTEEEYSQGMTDSLSVSDKS